MGSRARTRNAGTEDKRRYGEGPGGRKRHRQASKGDRQEPAHYAPCRKSLEGQDSQKPRHLKGDAVQRAETAKIVSLFFSASPAGHRAASQGRSFQLPVEG